MELVFFIVAVLLVGSFSYLVLCSIYFSFTSRPQLLALKLCWKLAIVSVVGIPIVGIGGVVFATLILHGQLAKTANYKQLRDILFSLSIAIACSVAIYFALIGLAFSILD